MQTKPTSRAKRPHDETMSGIMPATGARNHPDHAASGIQSGARAIATRRAAPRRPGQADAAMDYQQGFFSGPSS